MSETTTWYRIEEWWTSMGCYWPRDSGESNRYVFEVDAQHDLAVLKAADRNVRLVKITEEVIG